MKIIKLIFYIILISMLVGCSTPSNKDEAELALSKQNSNTKVPSDFGFILEYGIGAKNIINTFDGTFEKDLISAGSAKTKLNFSDEELKQIHNRIWEVNIFSYSDNYLPPYSDNSTPGIERMVEPYMTYNFHLRMNGETKDIHWEDTNGSDASKAKELRSLFNYIDQIIINKKEYKELPEAVGGYE